MTFLRFPRFIVSLVHSVNPPITRAIQVTQLLQNHYLILHENYFLFSSAVLFYLLNCVSC